MGSRSPLRALGIGGCGLCAIYACTLATPPAPTVPVAQPPGITNNLSTDDVWGVADLHAHPASHIAFGGLDGQAGLIWGDPFLPGGQMRYVPGGDLPDIPACDPQTHEANVSDEISRFTRGLVFENLTKITNYPHAPHGGPINDGQAPYASWPNGRDILHQVMNIQSIRRAYDGGLRLMFASTVEAQLLGFAMHTTVFPTPFTPSRALERASAEQQLQYIQAMVNANADWMEIASTPEQAESAILQGRLALIPALEQDGLSLPDIQYLVQTYGVGAVIPVHLVDNDVGGTAAYTDLFNSATYLEGAMFGYPNRYISVEPDTSLDFHLGWPLELQSLGVAYSIGNIPYSTAASLGYSEYPACCPVGQGIPPQVGERNSVGLRMPQTISALMAMGLLVDVAHMGFRSTDDTVTLARSTCGYPLLDTHTNVHAQNGGNERNIYLQHVAYVSSSQGVLGFGSSGSRQSELTTDPGAGGFNTIASARGGPLLAFGGGSTKASIIQFPQPTRGPRACNPPITQDVTALQVTVKASGGLKAGDVAYAQVGFDDGRQTYALVTLNQSSPVPLPESSTHVASLSINLGTPSSCSYGDNAVAIQEVTVEDESGDSLASTSPGDLGTVLGQTRSSIAVLQNSRSSFQVYARCPSGNATVCDAAEPYLPPMTCDTLPDEHVEIIMISGTEDLPSASALTLGARVGASLCTQPDCSDAPDPCSNPELTMTSAGGWPKGDELDAYYRVSRCDPAPSYAAISVCLTEPDLVGAPWELDSVSINLVVDPTRLWTGDYGNFLHQLFSDRPGAMALGTDMNGLAAQFPFSDFRPAYQSGSVPGCDSGASGNETYGDQASGGTFTLERPLRIGSTPLCFPERGLASYGMLPEFFDAIYHYNPAVYRSLFQSAKATIQAWKQSRAMAAQFATSPESCVTPPAPVAAVSGDALVRCAAQAGTDGGASAGNEGGSDPDAAIPGLCGNQ